MKEILGKILVAFVVVVIVACAAGVFYVIFSSDTNVDMFVVWLIFAAEGLKTVLKSGWNTAFAAFGTISLIIWFIYFIFRFFYTKFTFNAAGDIETLTKPEDGWEEQNEATFIKCGGLLARIGIVFWVLSLSMDFASVCIPTAKQAAVIYIVPKMVNNSDLREIPPNLAKLVNEGLKEMIESVKGGAVEAVKDTANVAKDAAKETANAAKEVAKGAAKEAIDSVAEKAKEKLKEKIE